MRNTTCFLCGRHAQPDQRQADLVGHGPSSRSVPHELCVLHSSAVSCVSLRGVLFSQTVTTLERHCGHHPCFSPR